MSLAVDGRCPLKPGVRCDHGHSREVSGNVPQHGASEKPGTVQTVMVTSIPSPPVVLRRTEIMQGWVIRAHPPEWSPPLR